MKFANWALYVVQAKAKYPIGSKIHEAIPALISIDDSNADNVSKLEKVPQCIILSLDPVRKRVSQSFLHQSTTFSFLGEEVNLVGVSGYEGDSASPLQFDPDSFLSFTDEIKSPSLMSFMSLMSY